MVTSTTSTTTDVYRGITAHFDLVHQLFDESTKVHHGDPMLLHKTFFPKKPEAKNFEFGNVSASLRQLYPRTYKYSERFVFFQGLQPKVVKPGGGVKLLIITLTMSHELGYREVHRRTWMSRPGICKINASTLEEPRNCRAFVTFAVGKVGRNGIVDGFVDEEARLYGDVTRVDAQDPSATGFNPHAKLRHKEKDLAMLLYASNHWSWVTHLGKNDLDNYPQVDLILKDISDPEGMKLGASKGKPPTNWSADKTRPIYYGALMGGDPAVIVQTMPGSFIQGQFYAITRSLMVCVMGQLKFTPADYVFPRGPQQPPCIYEPEGDMVWGCLVRKWTIERRTNLCSVPWWISVRWDNPPRWHLCKP